MTQEMKIPANIKKKDYHRKEK